MESPSRFLRKHGWGCASVYVGNPRGQPPGLSPGEPRRACGHRLRMAGGARWTAEGVGIVRGATKKPPIARWLDCTLEAVAISR